MSDPQPTDVIDARGLLCVQVLLLVRQHITELPPGAIVPVATDDPAAPVDLPAWCHLTGHTYLGSERSTRYGTVHLVQVAEDATPVDPQRPWSVNR